METLNNLTAKQIANLITRAESDGATPNELRMYRKGAKSMLQVFTDDTDFIEQVMNEFDNIYK